MNETRTITDPFLNKQVEISDRLTDRLRGKYAVGPTLPNGEPEFGWEQYPTPPMCHDAAAEIERLRAALKPFAGDKMPSLQKSEISFNRDGLRCAMSPMEIARTAAIVALRKAS